MHTIKLSDETFDTKRACAVTGISTKQIVDWDKKGIAKPSVQSARGRGSRRLYAYSDLLALSVVRELRNGGTSLQKIRRCVRYLRAHLPDISQPLTFCTLITDRQTIQIVEDQATLIDTVKHPGQLVSTQLFNLAGLDRELRARAVKIWAKRVEEVAVGEETYQVEVEPDEDGGYVATVAGLPGCITDGETLDEVLEMARDAITCWLAAHEQLQQQGIRVPIRRRRTRRRTA